MADKILITNCSELVTLEPLASQNKLTAISDDDLGIITDAWMLIEDGKVLDFGTMFEAPEKSSDMKVIDVENHLVTPGLVDSHTHPLFAGDRAHEFVMRLEGRTYQEIAEAGGGIKASVIGSREYENEALEQLCLERLNKFLHWGVTTVETKTGYGLSAEEELRHLEILGEVQRKAKQSTYRTCLALHAIAPEFDNAKAYIDSLGGDFLSKIAEKHLAEAVDVFIEEGYFSVDDVNSFMEEAKKLGFDVRVHADEFSDARGAEAAAKWGAKSADHLQYASQVGIKAMAEAGVVATLLPGTSLYTNIPYTKAKAFLDANCPVAVATDFNPGSCRIDNLAFIATLAALHCGMTRSQAFAAVTYVAASALGMSSAKGALDKDHDADFIIHRSGNLNEWFADLGQNRPKEVWIKGKKVLQNTDP